MVFKGKFSATKTRNSILKLVIQIGISLNTRR